MSNMHSCRTISAFSSMPFMSPTSASRPVPTRVALTDLANLNKPVVANKDALKHTFPKPVNIRTSVHSRSIHGTQALKTVPTMRGVTNGSGLAAVQTLNIQKTPVCKDEDTPQQAPTYAGVNLKSETHSISNQNGYSARHLDVVYEDTMEQWLNSRPAPKPVLSAAPKSLVLTMPDNVDQYNVTQPGTFGPIQAPIFTARHRKELEDARRFVLETEAAEQYEAEMKEIVLVREYSEDIIAYMIELEDTLKPDGDYIENQPELTWPMRPLLLDWVVEAHAAFQLHPETLHLAINLIDCFLSKKVIARCKLQLVGATALLIASKYEETNPISVLELVFMMEWDIKHKELKRAEEYMMQVLDWKLGYPSPLNFVRRMSKVDDYDEKIRNVTKYLIEVAMMDDRFMACRSSLVAAGTYCFARTILGAGSWSKAHVYYSGYPVKLLMTFMYNLYDCLCDAWTHHPAVFEKYTKSRFQPAILVHKCMAKCFMP